MESFNKRSDRGASRSSIFAALALTTLVACNKASEDKKMDPVVPDVSAEQEASAKPVISNPLICTNGSFKRKGEVISKLRNSFKRAGARTKRINPANYASLLPECNGAFVVGGGDIDTTKIAQSEPINPASRSKLIPIQRQEFDRRFITWARQNKVPLFGECLGMQEIGVWESSGASFNQHIPDVSNMINHRGLHRVYLDEKASIFGLGLNPTVKSNHHQALEDPLPSTLEVVGRSRDGVMEAMISSDGLVWGIQWHPRANTKEEMIYENFAKMVSERGKR